MRYCPSCGAAAGPGLRFCTSCGVALPTAQLPPAPADSVFAAPPAPAPWHAPTDESWDDGSWDDGQEDEGGRRPLVVAGVVVAALLAVGLGYVVADSTLGGDGTTAASETGNSDSARDEDEDGEAAAPTGQSARPAGDDPLRPSSVSATCQAPPGVDAANVPVTYDPIHTLDGVGGTAWRCPGAAVGEQLVFDFGRPVTLASVGLVPGYDKIDPVDGTDRFGENRTVTAVTWRFDGGDAHRQEIASPSRSMARSELDEPVTTTRVVLEITRTGNDGAVRDFTTISDVAFTGSD